MQKILLFLEKIFAYVFLTFLRITFNYQVTGLDKPYPKGVYVFWHRNIISLLINRRNEDVVIIISSSRDGDYIAEPAKLFGYIPVRGSSRRNGSTALKEMIKLSKNHSLAITPDGPKGPAQKLKSGALELAYLTKLPIYAVKVTVDRAWIFNSWDKFILPKPFAKIAIQYSQPFYIDSKDNFEQLKDEIESWLNSL